MRAARVKLMACFATPIPGYIASMCNGAMGSGGSIGIDGEELFPFSPLSFPAAKHPLTHGRPHIGANGIS